MSVFLFGVQGAQGRSITDIGVQPSDSIVRLSTGEILPVEGWRPPEGKGLDDFYYARLPFPEAQKKLNELQPTGRAKLIVLSWHGTRVDRERGSFAVVRTEGVLFDWIGWRVKVTVRIRGGKQRVVYAFIHNAAGLVALPGQDKVPELSLPRRMWLALASPGLDTLTATVQKVPRP